MLQLKNAIYIGIGSDPDWSLVCVPVVFGTVLPKPPTFLPLEPRPDICAEDFLPNILFWSVVKIVHVHYKIYCRLRTCLSIDLVIGVVKIDTVDYKIKH